MRNGVTIIPVYTEFRDSQTSDGVLNAYRTAVRNAKCRVRGILFCNPHNPLGHILREDVVDSLLKFCEEKDLHFISDEIYALSAFGALSQDVRKNGGNLNSPAMTFVSVLERDLAKLKVNPARVHQVYSISKDFGSSGLRLVSQKLNAFPSRTKDGRVASLHKRTNSFACPRPFSIMRK